VSYNPYSQSLSFFWSVEMTNVELVKLWKSVVESKGTWTDIVSGYREATGSEAKDASLKSSITNRINTIRKELSSRGVSDEKVAEALPKLRRETKTKNMDDVCAFLIGEGQMEAAE
jgi:hypothetical protein